MTASFKVTGPEAVGVAGEQAGQGQAENQDERSQDAESVLFVH
jgi:hypothetical protein